MDGNGLEHPAWCDRQRCRAKWSGPHVGERLAVRGDEGELAAMWQEGSNGASTVRLSATPDRPWRAVHLQELALYAARLAARVSRDG